MPKLSTTVTQTVELTLEQRVQAMLVARCEESARLHREVKERKERLARLVKEVEELFAKADVDATLEDGAVVEGFKIKRVRGKSKKLDKMALMKALGLDAEELDAFYDETENAPYIKITAPGDRGGGDD